MSSSPRSYLSTVPRTPSVSGDVAVRPPVPLTSLIGRERELADVAALLLNPAIRLVTLTGPGGVGKTRLAVRLAADLAEHRRFADGVWFVDLTSVRDPTQVMPTIARVLGMRSAGREPAEAMLATHLRDKALLVVLDNFEQVNQAGPRITDLLKACPGLTTLLTSRLRVNVAGEHVVPVPPLTLPESADSAESEAVRLFVERTRAVNPAFVLSASNADAVGAIVRRLDGLPLAIELAAARGTLLSPAALLARLDYRLPHLVGGPQDHPIRHQTMRGAIAWSYDLLTAEEQRVFRALGTFVGGCTMAAAEAVAGGQGDRGIEREQFPVPLSRSVFETIESLTRHSLLRVADSVDPGTPRIEMLETIREFAVEQLVAHDERDPSRRHAEYFAVLAEGAEPAFWGDAPGDLQDGIELEEGNLEAAQTWAMQTGETDLALRLASSGFDRHLGSYFRFTSGTDARSTRQRVRSALVMPGGIPANRVRALTAAAWIVGYDDDYAESLALAAKALDLARAHEDQFGVASALLALGAARLQRGDVEAARVPLRNALARFRALKRPGRCAWTLAFLASLDARDAIDEGGSPEDLARATALAEEALAIFRTVDVPSGISRALHVLAYIAFKRRDLPRALALTQEVLARDWARRWTVFTYLEDIADIAGRTGQAEVAARMYGAAEAQREWSGQPVQPLYRAEFERDADVARRALGDVAFAGAWARGKQQPLEDVVAEALALRAEPPPPPVHLTRRETEIVRLLAAGLSDAAIAEALFLSVRTVESHVARAFAKLGVRSRADATAIASELGLSVAGTRAEDGEE